MPREVGPAFTRQYVDLFKVLDGPVTVESFDNPLAAVVNRFVASADMKVGAYTIANAASADGFAHVPYIVRTVVDAADTPGTIIISGTDAEGAAISDTLIPGANGVVVSAVKAFQTVTSVVAPAGWVIGAAGADTITVGASALVGLGHAAAADADVLTCYDKTSLAATANFLGKGNGTVAGTYFTATGANGALDYTVVYRRVNGTALLANTAATLATSPALGFVAHVEKFGFKVADAFAGVGGTLTYQLCNAAGGVIVELTLPLASCGAGAVVEASVAQADMGVGRIPDAGTLVLKRKATGTAFTSGSGTFYVRLAQRPQARI